MNQLVLLHGAIGAKDQLLALQSALTEDHFVHTINFPGHGGDAMPGIFTIPAFAEEVIAYMQRQGIEKANIFGYSMGGYVAMYLAKHHPQKVNKVLTLATKFYWDEAVAAKEINMLQPEIIEVKIPAFAKALEQRHVPNNWKEVMQKTAAMLAALGKQKVLQTGDYESIQHACLLMLGDRDKMVTLPETVDVYKELPNAQLCLLPGTSHPIEQVDIPLLAFHIKHFLQY